MTLVPETDATRINQIINDDSVRPWVCGTFTGVLDATPYVENRENIFFTDIHGGCGLLKKNDGSYDLHSFVLPSGRGRWVRDNFFKVRDWLFTNTTATAIITMVPVCNRMALGAARICGFKYHKTIEDAYPFEGKLYDIDYYMLYKGVA